MTALAAPEQCMAALDLANEARTKRATLKRDLKAGKVSIRDLLLDPPEHILSARVFDLLLAVPKYGRVSVSKVLRRCRISPSRTIGDLSPRQRTELVSMLGRSRSTVRASVAYASRGTAPGAQHMRALATANRGRLHHASLKARVAKGELSVAEVLRSRPPGADTITIGSLLAAQYRWGKSRTLKFVKTIPVAETKQVGSLTERQCEAIIRALSPTAGVMACSTGTLHIVPTGNPMAACGLIVVSAWSVRARSSWGAPGTRGCIGCSASMSHRRWVLDA